MDYLAYYKLVLKESFGGEFPEMSSGEFERRCALKTVPAALKACYMALGTERICFIHRLLLLPEELLNNGDMVCFINEQDFVWGIRTEHLGLPDPPVCKLDSEGREIDEPDRDKCLSYTMMRIMQQLGGTIQQPDGWFDFFRNIPTRRISRFVTIISIFILVLVIKSNSLFYLKTNAQGWFNIASLLLLLPIGWLAYSVFNLFCYWNVWMDINDNVRFIKSDEDNVNLIRDLTLCYFRLNQPEIWFGWHTANANLNSELSLLEGVQRFCQFRYDFITDFDGTLIIPGFPSIQYAAGKQTSLLLRSTLDESGCLKFTHIKTGHKWKLPKPLKLELRSLEISQSKVDETMVIKMGETALVPDNLRDMIRAQGIAIPQVRRIWIRPAIMENQQVYLLIIDAEKTGFHTYTTAGLNEILKHSSLSVRAVAYSENSDLTKDQEAVYSRKQ